MKLSQMARRFALPSLSAAAIFTQSGCIETMDSDQVSPEAVYQKYSVTYHSEGDWIEARASFRAGGPLGTTLELIEPSYVKLNGDLMTGRELFGTHYEKAYYHPKAMTYSWVYVDQDKQEYAHTIELHPLKLLQPETIVNRTQDYVASVEGPALRSGESIELQYFYKLGEEISFGSIEATFSGNQIKVDTGKIREIIPANATQVKFQFARILRKSLKGTVPQGGDITATYKTQSYLIDFAP